MKTFDLPSNSNYGDRPIPVTFPDHWDVHISRIHGYDTPALTEAQIREKLHAAIGTKPISEGAAGKKSAVIIIDDITRPTPCEPIARAVIAELHAAGVPDENIWFIIALGTHGVMYRTEFVRKLGEELVENYEVHNHNLFFNHVFVGNTSNNVPVEINADVMSADYKIAIGTTMAHSYYGFGGGAKCILPGVSSLRTIMRNHSFTTTTEFNMGNPHSADAIRALKASGVRKTVMLTGDAQPVAQAVAQQLGLDEYHAGLLPGDKVDQIEKLLAAKQPKENLAFVGDGINDAPVLSRADVGIAMGALGSDAAIEAADVVLMDDDPAKIALAMRIARRTLRIVHQNIVFALGIKALCLLLGALGIAGMWAAIFADVGVMVIAVLNATRALYTKDLAGK